MRKILFIIVVFLFFNSSFAQEIIFEDDFDGGTFKSNWELNPNLEGVSGIVVIENGLGGDGSAAVRIGKSSDGMSFTTNALDLHLNLLGRTEVELSFWIRDQYDQTQIKDGIYFSDDGGANFTKALDFYPDEWCDATWGFHPPIDVDEIVGNISDLELTENFVIRFQQTGIHDFGGASSNVDGFYLDDVNVYNPELVYKKLPIEDSFDSGSFDKYWAVNFADASSSISTNESITNPMSVVDIINNAGLEGTSAVCMGRRCDGTYTTNALDLHLDLEGEAEVEMSFWIRDQYDETDADDGIYFSNDGGLNFKKALDFYPDEWCDAVWGFHPPIDIDELAVKLELELTNQFIIRFQQRGHHDFGGASSNVDGFYLDDVNVYNPALVYKKLPIEDSFDSGSFEKYWAVNFANASTSFSTNESITNPMSIVDIFNNVGLEGTPAVCMGRRCDGTYTTNALDLHLDLEGEMEVEMSFWIRGQYDETDADDGIYFSNDGGLNFTKALDLYPDEWCDTVWGKHPPIDIDELAGRLELELTDQFIIRFQQRGHHDFGGASSNVDGFYLDEVNVYNPALVYKKLPIEDSFDSGSFEKYWAVNFADASTSFSTNESITNPMSIVGIFNNVGLEGTPGVCMGRRCDGTYTTNALDLHLDLEGEAEVEMSFWIRDQYDETDVDDGIYFSNDGGLNFKKALDFYPDEWCDARWGKHPPIDIDELAGRLELELTNQFIIRFQQRGHHDFGGNTVNVDGFYLDNVNVYNPGLVYKTLPVMDDFNTGSFEKYWAVNFADSSSLITSNGSITNPMSFVGIPNGIGLEGTPGVRMGRRCDGTFTTNALDLHLNLEGEIQVEMEFWIRDHYDETHLDDGIYFSDDGGVSFKKVLDFYPNEWCDAVWGKHPPIDVDELAALVSLELTNQFVIRFQQHGHHDFGGATSNIDGFDLDNVNVFVPLLDYATLPFEDTFEDGALNENWNWNFADQTSTIVSDDAITNPMSLVGVFDGFGYDNSTYSLLMGKRCDGTFTTNALDLHLNLFDEENVELTFWLADHYDETQLDDGIYFSNNAGLSFTKVYDFQFSDTPNDVYELYQLNISDLALDNDLLLSDQFVVRFQQRGQSDFGGATSNLDGIYLDDINVRSMTTSISKINTAFFADIYPNPSTSKIYIDLQNTNESILNYQIIDINGRILINNSTDRSHLELDVSNLIDGIYIVSLTLSDGKVIHQRISKN